MKPIQVLATTLALSACSKVSKGKAWSVKDAEIIFVSETLPDCGVLYTLVEMELRGNSGENKTIYLPCVEVIDGPLPKVGTVCSAFGEMEIANDFTSNRTLSLTKPIRVTRELTCDGKKYVFDL